MRVNDPVAMPLAIQPTGADSKRVEQGHSHALPVTLEGSLASIMRQRPMSGDESVQRLAGTLKHHAERLGGWGALDSRLFPSSVGAPSMADVDERVERDLERELEQDLGRHDKVFQQSDLVSAEDIPIGHIVPVARVIDPLPLPLPLPLPGRVTCPESIDARRTGVSDLGRTGDNLFARSSVPGRATASRPASREGRANVSRTMALHRMHDVSRSAGLKETMMTSPMLSTLQRDTAFRASPTVTTLPGGAAETTTSAISPVIAIVVEVPAVAVAVELLAVPAAAVAPVVAISAMMRARETPALPDDDPARVTVDPAKLPTTPPLAATPMSGPNTGSSVLTAKTEAERADTRQTATVATAAAAATAATAALATMASAATTHANAAASGQTAGALPSDVTQLTYHFKSWGPGEKVEVTMPRDTGGHALIAMKASSPRVSEALAHASPLNDRGIVQSGFVPSRLLDGEERGYGRGRSPKTIFGDDDADEVP